MPIIDITSEPKQPARDEKNANTLCLRDPVSRLKLQASIRDFSFTTPATGKLLGKRNRYPDKPCQNVSHCAFFSNPVLIFIIVHPLPSWLYLPNTFFTSPTFRSTLPAIFSVVPRSSKLGFPTAFPVSSFTLPATSFAVPFTLSVVLEFMLLIRRRSGFGLSGCVIEFSRVSFLFAVIAVFFHSERPYKLLGIRQFALWRPGKLETQGRIGRHS